MKAAIVPLWRRLRNAAVARQLEPMMNASSTVRIVNAMTAAKMYIPTGDPLRTLPDVLAELAGDVIARRSSQPGFASDIAAALHPRTEYRARPYTGPVKANVGFRRALALMASHRKVAHDLEVSLGAALARLSGPSLKRDGIAGKVETLPDLGVENAVRILDNLLARLGQANIGVNWYDVADKLNRWDGADKHRVRSGILFDFYRAKKKL